MTEILPIILFVLVLASLSATTPAAAQESNACNQYECAEELDPSGGKDPAVEQPSDEPSPPVEGKIPSEKRVGTEQPTPPTSDREESRPEAEHSKISPTSEPMSVSQKAGNIASGKLNKESIGPQEYHGNEKTPAEGSGKNTNRPLPGYPYSGKACEETHCGLPDVEKHYRCAAYQTASGKTVYGCTNPRTFDKRSCFEITFYTRTGKPYSHLDTCSGERPYAPPEPPNGEFNYFEPPANPYSAPDWAGHSVDQCYFDQKGEWAEPTKGLLDPHCGLENPPKHWNCEVYYDTAYGTVRGCHEGIELYGEDRFCSRPLHLYDEAGREIDAVPSCPKVRSEKCGAGQCGAPVPSDWTCRREHWSFGKLYGGEIGTFRRCASPDFYEYINNERPPCTRRNAKPISALYDERGKRVDGMTCLPGGSGGDLGEWAGLEAKQTDDTLNKKKRRPTTDSSDDAGMRTVSEERSGQPGAEGAPGSPVTEPRAEEPEPEELEYLSSSGEGDTGSAKNSAAKREADSGRSGPEYAGNSLDSSRGSSGNQVSPSSEEDVNNKDRSKNPVPGLPGESEKGTPSEATTGKRKDVEYKTLSESRTSVAGDALPENRDNQSTRGTTDDKGGQRESSNSGALTSTAEPEGSSSGDGDRARANTASGTDASKVGGSDWLGGLVPLGGLGAVAGMFVLRRRFFV